MKFSDIFFYQENPLMKKRPETTEESNTAKLAKQQQKPIQVEEPGKRKNKREQNLVWTRNFLTLTRCHMCIFWYLYL